MTARFMERLLLVLGPAGLFIAGVLSLRHVLNLKIPCGASGGCEVVATHPTSMWFNIPVAYFGFGAYLALTLVAILMSQNPAKRDLFAKLGLVTSFIGTALSGWLTYTAIAVIKATCVWCLASASVMAATLICYVILTLVKSDEKKSDPFTWMIVGAACLAASGGIVSQSISMKQQALGGAPLVVSDKLTVQKLVANDAYFLGSPSAKITIVEYADFFCPACRDMYATLKGIYTQGNGTVRIAYRHLPFFQKQGHEQALTAAVISEYAATKGKYWEWIDLMFTSDIESINTYPKLLAKAKSIGLDEKELAEMITKQDKTLLEPISADIQNSNQMAISSTPSYVIFAEGLEPVGARMADLVSTLGKPEYQKLMTSQLRPGPLAPP